MIILIAYLILQAKIHCKTFRAFHELLPQRHFMKHEILS